MPWRMWSERSDFLSVKKGLLFFEVPEMQLRDDGWFVKVTHFHTCQQKGVKMYNISNT